MDDRRSRMIAELIKHLEAMDGEDLKGAMAPPPVVEEEVAVDVAGLDPEKTKDFEAGFKGALGGGAPKPTPAPGKVAMNDGTDPASAMNNEELDDEEFEEMMKLNA